MLSVFRTGSYYRNPDLVQRNPIGCFKCGQPLSRIDLNRFKILFTCPDCGINVQLKTHEAVLTCDELKGA